MAVVGGCHWSSDAKGSPRAFPAPVLGLLHACVVPAGDFSIGDLESDPAESLFGSSWLSRVYAATFMMLVVILLLNLLIAIINDT